ncbi:MAG: hypothetical protein J7J78_02480 [Thermoprotei archaeon]|nr:hypothetical protein [Thermoprotei archaeon]
MGNVVKPARAMIALAVVLIFLLSLPYPVFSSSIYGWREFIVLAEDAIVKVNVGISAKGNVWDLTYPLEVYVDATLLKEEKTKPTYIYLKLTYSINSENVGSDELYVGVISSLNSLLKVSLQIHPKGEIIEKASGNVDSVEITPEIIVIRGGKVFESQPAAAFIIPIIPPVTGTEISSSTYAIVGANATVYLRVSTRYPWNVVSENPILNVEVYGENVNDQLSIVAIVQINGRMITSQFLGSFSGNFRKSFQIFMPSDTLKNICLGGSVKVDIEFLVLGSKGDAIRKTLSLTLKCINPKDAIRLYASYPPSVFSGEEFTLDIIIRNTLAGASAKLSTIEVYADNKLIKTENLGDVNVPPLSKYEYPLRLMLSEIGDHILTVKVHYAVGLFYGEVEKDSLKITVLNPVSLQALTNVTEPGGTIILKAFIGLPRISGKLQMYINETDEWKIIKEVKLTFPETIIKTAAPYSEGKYVYRLLLENGIASNSVEVVVSEKAAKKPTKTEKAAQTTTTVNVVAKPSIINVNSGEKVTIQATVQEKNLSLELVRYDPTIGDWVLISNANISRKTETSFTITFNAPTKAGTYKYKLIALKEGKRVGESNIVLVNVSSVEKKVAAQPIIPFEMFTATLSTMGALSFIIWRRYRA